MISNALIKKVKPIACAKLVTLQPLGSPEASPLFNLASLKGKPYMGGNKARIEISEWTWEGMNEFEETLKTASFWWARKAEIQSSSHALYRTSC